MQLINCEKTLTNYILEMLFVVNINSISISNKYIHICLKPKN